MLLTTQGFQQAEVYSPSDLDEVLELAKGSQFKPYRSYSTWNEQVLADLFALRVRCAIDKGSDAFVVRSNGRINALAVAEYLPWDSAQLNFPCGRVVLLIHDGEYAQGVVSSHVLLSTVGQYLEKKYRVKHLTLRADAADLAAVHAAGHMGYEQMDGIIVFARNCVPLDNCDFETGDYRVRLSEPRDAEALASLARSAYSITRFHVDPHIPQQVANGLHAAWLRNSCIGTAADAVVLAEDEHGPLGYVTCSLSKDTAGSLGSCVGTIVLVATASRARCTGVAKRMTAAAIGWFNGRGCSVVEVGTQLANIAASRLYENCGFRIVGSCLTLRKWFD